MAASKPKHTEPVLVLTLYGSRGSGAQGLQTLPIRGRHTRESAQAGNRSGGGNMSLLSALAFRLFGLIERGATPVVRPQLSVLVETRMGRCQRLLTRSTQEGGLPKTLSVLVETRTEQRDNSELRVPSTGPRSNTEAYMESTPQCWRTTNVQFHTRSVRNTGPSGYNTSLLPDRPRPLGGGLPLPSRVLAPAAGAVCRPEGAEEHESHAVGPAEPGLGHVLAAPAALPGHEPAPRRGRPVSHSFELSWVAKSTTREWTKSTTPE